MTEDTRPKKGPRKLPDRFKDRMFLVPSLITVLAIFCGFLAILSAVKGNFETAVKYIALGIILDGLDGRVARRLNATSEFGREFDSLSDVITFGIAPAILVYSWAFQAFADEFGVLVAFLIVVCGATRLARFNIDTAPRKHFLGLPIPAQAVAVSSLVYFHPQAIDNHLISSLIMAYVFLVSFLMVSKIEYFSVKHLKLTDGNPRFNMLILAAIVAAAWYQTRLAFLIVTTAYVVSGPIMYVVRKLSPKTAEEVQKAVSN